LQPSSSFFICCTRRSDSKNLASNLSGETISIEAIPSRATCPSEAPFEAPLLAFTEPITPPSPLGVEVPDLPFDLPPEEPQAALASSCDKPVPECAAGFNLRVINEGACNIEYICEPPPPPPPPPPVPPSCAQMAALASQGHGAVNAVLFVGYNSDFTRNEGNPHDGMAALIHAVPPNTSVNQYYQQMMNEASCGIVNNNRGTCYSDGSQYGGEYDGSCYCPIVLSLDDSPLEIYDLYGVKFSFDGKHSQKTHWMKSSRLKGFLAADFNRNGQIDSGRELFGQFTFGKKYEHGYQALKELRDKNKDGFISGDELLGLMLWSDLNYDGKSQKNELQSLKALNVLWLKIKDLNYKKISLPGAGIYPYIDAGLMFKTKGESKMSKTYDLWLAPYSELAIDESYAYGVFGEEQ
jgi:hypothetical protein